MVRYRAGATVADLEAAKARLGLVAKRTVEATPARRRIELIALPRFTTTAAALAVLRADPAVEIAEPNFYRYRRSVVPDDPLFGDQWGLRNTGQENFIATGPAGIPGADLNMIEAWDEDGDGTADRTGSPDVIVAVIDDAIQIAHPDLADNVVAPRNFVSCQRADDPSPITSTGAHGTQVSGCVAGRGDNGVGVAGAAWNTSLMPLKFDFTVDTHLEALEYARANGADIINASFGGPGFSQIEADLIASLADDDILYVAAAGNDDSNTDVAGLSYPANYAADNIVSVAATNRQDDIASFSQYGLLTTDVAAPGLQIVSTSMNNSYALDPGVSGTSFASPYTAGVASLLRAHVLPTPDFLEMKARLIESGTAVAGANAKRMTAGGRVDADAALDMAPRPALVITEVAFADGGNNLPDPGETLDVTLTVRNLWQGATNVTATLAVDDAAVTVDSGQQSLGDIASLGTATATFQITVTAPVTAHRYLTFTTALAADGGYAAERNARAELGTLDPGTEMAAEFGTEGYDDFHAWHFDVADGAGKTLFIRTRQAGGEDIDLLVKHAVPPQYAITLGTTGLFCTSGTADFCRDPDTLVGGRGDGTEEISVVDPPAGTYHAVVVNFAQLEDPLGYTIEGELLDGDLRPDDFSFPVLSTANAGSFVSGAITVQGITGPTPITVAGGSYQVGSGVFTTDPGTVGPGQTVRLGATLPNTGASAQVEVTIGGVTNTWFINPLIQVPGTVINEASCPQRREDSLGGAVPLSTLALLALATLVRRRRAA